ncbi:hypothetical protein BHYA_0107g00140 [Botrytis hyacinthi]|uniref:Uncharacterized protein n=1 Tax=Botrytis hyacinthi TaxID=278943 RepID=A0A4Z1GNS1_9HELO|nr:hypothetical protein BHYA_0107g00140 [Botrytis hyacinthi]
MVLLIFILVPRHTHSTILGFSPFTSSGYGDGSGERGFESTLKGNLSPPPKFSQPFSEQGNKRSNLFATLISMSGPVNSSYGSVQSPRPPSRRIIQKHGTWAMPGSNIIRRKV